MKICTIIPAYNEAKTIGYLVEEIKKRNFDVLVIDDGSKDQTARIAKEKGATVITNEKNVGKGASLRKCFDFVINKDYDGFLIMDGDGQHDPENIPVFLGLIQKSNAKIINGNRMLSAKNMPLLRWLTNKTMSWFISAICKQYIPDSQCGYRYISKEVLKAIELSTSNFEIETEVLIEARKKGFRIYHVPVNTIYQDHKSRINPFLDTFRFFRFIFRKR
ncbi:MAG: glycosyltransferase family 2 protein [Candidatus Omnitrophica bacterium]|nr:glycosyltransferase family 2 protein [Candidatus Omnitrophota bacterium]